MRYSQQVLSDETIDIKKIYIYNILPFAYSPVRLNRGEK